MLSQLCPTIPESRPPVLVNRGWIDQEHGLRSTRPKSVEPGTTIIKGLGSSCNFLPKSADVPVRPPSKKGWFLPKNDFERGRFYSVDVPEMATSTGCEPLLVEQTFGPLPLTHSLHPVKLKSSCLRQQMADCWMPRDSRRTGSRLVGTRE